MQRVPLLILAHDTFTTQTATSAGIYRDNSGTAHRNTSQQTASIRRKCTYV